MTDHLLDVDQVAEIVGLSAFTIRRAIRAGELPASKLRNRWRIAPNDVADWVERSRHQPTPPTTPNGKPIIAPRPRTHVPRGGIRAMIRDERDAS